MSSIFVKQNSVLFCNDWRFKSKGFKNSYKESTLTSALQFLLTKKNKIFNNLPSDMNNINNVNIFKISLHKLLLQNSLKDYINYDKIHITK